MVRPRAMIGFVGTYIAMNLLALYFTTPLFPPGVSTAAHLGGFATGSACVLLACARAVHWVAA